MRAEKQKEKAQIISESFVFVFRLYLLLTVLQERIQ